MKVCSFLPAATQIMYDLGLEDLLVGVTFECPAIAIAQKPKVVRCILEDKHYTSQEIDVIFSASKAQGRSLYYVDQELLEVLQPDIIFTQDVCEVCQIDTACTMAAVTKLKKQPLLVPLTPQSLEDVFNAVITIAQAVKQEEKAYNHLSILQNRIGTIIDLQRKHRVLPKKVMLLEWIEPIYNCGHWIPYQIAYAGGIDMLSHPGGDSIKTPWEKIVRYNPEILVIAPCGFVCDRTLEEIPLLSGKPEWHDLKAVKEKQVFIADFDLFTQPSASTLVDGITVLSKIFHPNIMPIPSDLTNKFSNYFDLVFA